MTDRTDMTVGIGWKHVVRFSLPLMLGNLLQQLYSTVDGIIVGQMISEQALAAVGNCTMLIYLFLAIAMGLSNGASVALSQYFGARQEKNMRRCASSAILLHVGIGVVCAAAGILLAPFLLQGLMGTPEGEVLTFSKIYFRVYAIGFLFLFAYNILAAILRAVGDSRATMYFLLISSFLNIGLDLLFVGVFHLGVAGAAAATVLSQAVSMLCSWIYLMSHYAIFRFRKGEFVYDRQMGAICLKLGVPTMLQQGAVALGGVIMQRLVNSFGGELMAAYTVGNRVQNYAFIPIFGFNSGMAVFAGQNIGAGKTDRVQEAIRKVDLLSVLSALVISALSYAFAGEIAAAFGVQGESRTMAVEMIQFMSLFLFLFAIYLPLMGLLQGAGDTFYTMLCSILTLALRIATAYFLVFYIHMDYHATWICIPVGWTLGVFMGVGRYLSGKWKKKSVVRWEERKEDE
jgi:putative MATE family efflux protein